MADQKGSCAIERLNLDCLILILSACDSADDLWSFVRAAPFIHQCFQENKARILCRVNSNILGGLPAMRDAIFLSCCDPIAEEPRAEYQGRLEGALYLYRNLLLRADEEDGAPLASDIGWDTIVEVTQLTNTACRFTDLYAQIRFRAFGDMHLRESNIASRRQRLENQDDVNSKIRATRHLTTTERQRLAAALIRLRIVRNLQGRSRPFDMEPFIAAMFPLFEAWEWEQISEMEIFVFRLAYTVCDFEELIWPNNPAYAADRPQRARFSSTDYRKLDVFAGKLKLLDRDFPVGMSSIVKRSAGEKSLGYTEMRWLAGTRAWKAGVANYYQPFRGLVNDAVFVDVTGSDETLGPSRSNRDTIRHGRPPWAWVDAMNGRNVKLWGYDLSPGIQYGKYTIPNTVLPGQLYDLIRAWRWHGIMFWDRGRTEELLESNELEGCRETGWLERIITQFLTE